jgi:hypothetical protein
MRPDAFGLLVRIRNGRPGNDDWGMAGRDEREMAGHGPTWNYFGNDSRPLPLTPSRKGRGRLAVGGQTGANIGTGGPSSLGTNFSFTLWPIFSAAKSQSTRLVIIDGPSSSVT